MAAIAFIGFDLWKYGGAGSYQYNTGAPYTFHWQALCKPTFVYTSRGLAGSDATLGGAEAYSGNTVTPWSAGRENTLGAWGNPLSGTTTTRTNWLTTYRMMQLAILKSATTLTNEVYLTMDFRTNYPSSTLSSTFESTSPQCQMFIFGDVSVRVKSATWDGGASMHTYILSIRNAGSEVATVTFTTAPATWNFFKIHVKLDNTTGLIDCSINGTAQSVAYTSQNTIGTTSVANASAVWFGPAAADNGTTIYLGGYIDNVYIDDAAFPSGRPTARLLTLSGETAVSATAIGTGATTLRDAIVSDNNAGAGGAMTSSANNVKALRLAGAGANVIFDTTAPVTSDCDTDVLGIQVMAAGLAQHDFITAKALSLGVSLTGTANMGPDQGVPFMTLPHVQPANALVGFAQDIWVRTGSTKYTTTDLASMKIKMQAN